MLQTIPLHPDKLKMKPLDYTLYNKVKEKFPPQPNTVIFVSLAPDNLEKLEGIEFSADQFDELRKIAGAHKDALHSCAAIGGFQGEEIVFSFSCQEFEQEENLTTGKIEYSYIGTYNNDPVDLKALKKRMRSFNPDTLLLGNT